MQRYRFSDLTRELVASLVDLRETEGEPSWQPKVALLDEEDVFVVNFIKKKIQHDSLKKLNEATVWSKAIFPLLDQAETSLFAAWAQVEISAAFQSFVIEGIADGVIGKRKVGYLTTPYLVVLEAKKEIEAKDPQPQVYGAMLAAAKLNWKENRREPQTIYGCYTIGDSWTFLQGVVENIEAEKPTFSIQLSRDFIERFEAETILGILKAIVAENEQQN